MCRFESCHGHHCGVVAVGQLASLISWRSWVRVPPPQPNATMVEQADTRNLKFLGLSVPVRVWVVAPLFLDVVQFGRTLDLGSRGSQVRFLSSRPFWRYRLTGIGHDPFKVEIRVRVSVASPFVEFKCVHLWAHRKSRIYGELSIVGTATVC